MRFVVLIPLALRSAKITVTVSLGSIALFVGAMLSDVKSEPAGRIEPPSLSTIVSVAALALTNCTCPVGLDNDNRTVSGPSSRVSSTI